MLRTTSPVRLAGRAATLAAAALLAAAPGEAQATAGAAAAKRLTADAYLDLERVADPQISPDGSQVIYTRSHVDRLNDRWESELWLVDVDGRRNRFLVQGSSPRWSPDGSRIAFTAPDGEGREQIFVRWMDAEGAVTQVTRALQPLRRMRWSPDGERIAFVMFVEDEDADPLPIEQPEPPEGASWTEPPRVVSRLKYREERVGYVDSGYWQIHVVPASGGAAIQLTHGPWNHGVETFTSGTPDGRPWTLEWTPDGREIVYTTLRREDAEYQWRESEVYAMDVETGGVRQLTDRRGPDGGAVPSPDGRLVAYTGYDFTDDSYLTAKVYVMGRDGSGARLISGDLDRDMGELFWAADGRGVWFEVASEGTRNVWYASVDGDVRQVTRGTHVLRLGSVAGNGTAAAVLETPESPGDVVVLDLGRPGEIRRLTAVNADLLAGVELGELEEIRYVSKDGLEIQGWLIKPPGFDPARKYPLMLSIHGGPHGMYDVGFDYAWQEHAAHDYVVLYTNPRGSSGYGSEFGNEIENAYPDEDFDDLMAGVDAVIAKGYIDTDNLFVYGCSGGGVLTSWVVGHTDRFRAASANCPVTDWLSFVGTTDWWTWYRNFDALPWDDPTEHLRRSPLSYVGNVTTPTMLMTGVLDLRTPIAQTEQFYSALKLRKVPTLMIRFNDEWHGTSRVPSNFIRTQRYLRAWFEKWGTHEDSRVAAGGR